MTKQERETITDLKKCNFTELNEYFNVKNEDRKNMSKEAKQVGYDFVFFLLVLSTVDLTIMITVMWGLLSDTSLMTLTLFQGCKCKKHKLQIVFLFLSNVNMIWLLHTLKMSCAICFV